ncbi:hypothetical protein BDN67DRAFT_970336 [Paxillus ammoniavirescens]|nr:hypothetical protein BDN67DRAFT_970336 [Paxillus ammoniavirescens]
MNRLAISWASISVSFVVGWITDDGTILRTFWAAGDYSQVKHSRYALRIKGRFNYRQTAGMNNRGLTALKKWHLPRQRHPALAYQLYN